MSEYEIPEFPDSICLEWGDGKRIRIAMSDMTHVFTFQEKIDPSHAFQYENFGSFIAAMIAYVEGMEAEA